MKKLINLMFAIVLTFVMALAINVNAASSSSQTDDSVAEVRDTDGVKYYDDLTEALTEVKTNGVVKLLKSDVGSGNIYRPVASAGIINYTIDLNGQDIKGVKIYVADGSTVTFEDTSSTKSGKMTSTAGAAIVVQKGKAILKGGTYANGEEDSTKGAIQVGVGASGDTVGHLEVYDGVTINGLGYGITLFNENSTLNFHGGIISVPGFAISGNGRDTKTSEINISGGTVESTTTAAIYQPQTGTTTISGNAVIKGVFGIVARQGTVDIQGGTIIATGDGSEASVGDRTDENGNRIKLVSGTSVIVDNQGTSSYPRHATAKISGGDFKSGNNGATLTSLGDDATDFEVTSGSFDKSFDEDFVKNNSTELSVTSGNKTTWYVGNAAQTAAEEAPNGSEITVIQGDIEITNTNSNVTVKNEGDGEVTVNETSVETGKSVVANVKGTYNTSTEDNKGNTNNNNQTHEKDETPKTSVRNTLGYVSIITLISGVSLIIIKKSFN